ncbi:MAG TPA: hypothetical protein VJT70_02570 [Sphingomicrobium sp.]|nr:hypothetical protein [Sphingomicrobium sp.]
MPFSLHPESSHLRVEMTGLPTPGEVHAMFVAMVKYRQGPPRALIELQVEQCLSMLDTMTVMSAVSSLGFPADYRLALFIADETMRESAEFAETVGINRGIVVRVFDRRDAALAWLVA